MGLDLAELILNGRTDSPFDLTGLGGYHHAWCKFDIVMLTMRIWHREALSL